jgi:hypothetical protein
MRLVRGRVDCNHPQPVPEVQKLPEVALTSAEVNDRPTPKPLAERGNKSAKTLDLVTLLRLHPPGESLRQR